MPVPELAFGPPERIVMGEVKAGTVRAMNRRFDTVQPGRDALIGHSLAGEIVSWNPGATQLFGWTAQEAVGHDARLLVPDDQRLTEDELWRRVRCGEQWEAPAVQRLHKSGQIVDVSIWMSPVLDGSGTTIGVVSCSREVHPGADEVTFRRLFDALPDAVVCFDNAGVISRVNARAGQVFGCLPEQLIDHTIEEFVSGVSGPGGVVGGALPAVDAARHGWVTVASCTGITSAVRHSRSRSASLRSMPPIDRSPLLRSAMPSGRANGDSGRWPRSSPSDWA